jgi:hypothetical protein
MIGLGVSLLAGCNANVVAMECQSVTIEFKVPDWPKNARTPVIVHAVPVTAGAVNNTASATVPSGTTQRLTVKNLTTNATYEVIVYRGIQDDEGNSGPQEIGHSKPFVLRGS